MSYHSGGIVLLNESTRQKKDQDTSSSTLFPRAVSFHLLIHEERGYSRINQVGEQKLGFRGCWGREEKRGEGRR